MTLALLALATSAGANDVQVDKSEIRFVTKQMNVPVEGAFKRFDATVSFDPAKPEATKAEFEVDLASIDLGSDEGNTEAVRKTLGRRHMGEAIFRGLGLAAIILALGFVALIRDPTGRSWRTTKSVSPGSKLPSM